jgi:small-conductance mechanosensitive channel
MILSIPRLLLTLGLLTLLVFFHQKYADLTAITNLPPVFEHAAYRVIISYLVVESIRQIILIVYKIQNNNQRDNFTIGVSHISKVIYFVLALVILISLFNVSVKEAFTSLSLIAAAVVLMTKDYISNLINGMYLTFVKVVSIGDQVSIDGNKGKIMDITLTNVHLLNDDDDIIYIPNNKVFSSEIINYTRRELKKTSIEFEVDPLMVSDIALLESKLIDMLQPHIHEIQPGTCNLKTVSVKKEVLQLKFQYVLIEPLNKELDKKLRKFFIRGLVKLLHEESVHF